MFTLIETPEDLDILNKELLSRPYIAVDTEFKRKGKKDIKLALIQVNDSEETFIIDCLKIRNANDICSFVSSTEVKKIFHSYKEDAEAIFSWTNQILTNVFDTQLANAFLGGSFSIGYRDLVFNKLDVLIDKDETRSNWLKRPLRDSQLDYAATDVEFLIEIFFEQREALEDTKKADWLNQEIEHGLSKLFNNIQVNLERSNVILSKQEEKTFLFRFNNIVDLISTEKEINSTLLFSKKNQKDFLRNALNYGVISACNEMPKWRKELLLKDLNALFGSMKIN